ncbi:single-stranded DNA-binding protein [Candidatus Shapirobacteria bacterium CG_4_9_14_3_um_filter_36_12]|uniref:Single-stranded DNA-binding protein n=1 Tax=Candidatus Shapirobacteria bacterium CG_4_9_14_3_um_filter_36_12 TaxID=1974877 RepID=A0A2M7XML4_9BACT|nr:MAG: single-stranded DNA-binding protein [Candidatus Shapirobacteria bacterium CG_4_9_14_3_um_filter_36_12]
MPSRCLNRVLLIGNLTRDPELHHTPGGMAVVSFGLATNRVWVTKQGEKKEDAQFHRIVAWNKLAELCSQLLSKGRRIYVEGRIQYREIVDVNNLRKQVCEIVIDDMIILDNKNLNGGGYTNNSSSNGGQANLGQSDAVPESDMPVAGEMIEDVVIPDDLNVEIPNE